jgi:hypothetical protein
LEKILADALDVEPTLRTNAGDVVNVVSAGTGKNA